MKKNSIVLVVLMAIAFVQCTKPESKPEPVEISVKGEVGFGNGSKAIILPESGEINWKVGDKVYFFQPEVGPVELEVNEVSGYGNNHNGVILGLLNVAKVYDEGNGSYVIPRYLYRDLYYIGKNNQVINGNVMQMNISEQTGKVENIGDYLIMRADDVSLKQDENQYESGHYIFSRANFGPINSIARFNIPEQYRNNPITIHFEYYDDLYEEYWEAPIYNDFSMDIDDGIHKTRKDVDFGFISSFFVDVYEKFDYNKNYITITNPSSDTYVVFNAMSSGGGNPYSGALLRMVFKSGDDVIGTFTFPNGVTFGRYYTGPDFSSISLDSPGAKSLVFEHELF